MISIRSIPLFLTSLGVLSFGLLVLLKNPKKKLVQLFFGCALSVSIWSLGYGFVLSANDPVSALHYARIGYVGVVFIPTFFCHFVVQFLGTPRPRFIAACYFFSFLFLAVSRFPVFLTDFYKYSWGFYPKAGPVYPLFIAFFYGGFGICLYYLLGVFIKLRRTKQNPTMLNQVKYVMLAFAVASFSFSDYLPNYHYDVYPCAYLAATGWLVLMAYGTLRYRVLDINLIIRKTIIYSVVTGTVTAIYLVSITVFAHVFQGLSGYQTAFSSAVAAGLITICFQPLRKKIQTFVDGKFFRQFVDREEKLYELSRDVVTHTTPEAMGATLMNVISTTLHPKSGVLYLRSKNGTGFSRASFFGDYDFPETALESNSMATYFRDHPQPLLQDFHEDFAHTQDTREAAHRARTA